MKSLVNWTVAIDHFHHCKEVYGRVLRHRIWKDVYIPLEKEILNKVIEFVFFLLLYKIKKCSIL